jgi:long-chain acyl-CoA synthetase
LPPDQVGLVWLRAVDDERFRYHGDDDKTESTFRGDYFTLGDLGSMDADGFLYLSDRSAHLIISGGVNIYPAEIDAVLLEHPAVADAATIGIPNDEWGEEVKAVVELHEPLDAFDPAAMERELIAFCRDHLAHFKCPRSIDFVAQLPRQDNGKIAKVRLRDEYRRAHGPAPEDP